MRKMLLVSMKKNLFHHFLVTNTTGTKSGWSVTNPVYFWDNIFFASAKKSVSTILRQIPVRTHLRRWSDKFGLFSISLKVILLRFKVIKSLVVLSRYFLYLLYLKVNRFLKPNDIKPNLECVIGLKTISSVQLLMIYSDVIYNSCFFPCLKCTSSSVKLIELEA